MLAAGSARSATTATGAVTITPTEGPAIPELGAMDTIVIAESGDEAVDITVLRYRPADNVSADDSDYIEYTFTLHNAAGMGTATHKISTKFTSSGPTETVTGNRAAFEKVDAAVAWSIVVGGCISVFGISVLSGVGPRAFFSAVP